MSQTFILSLKRWQHKFLFTDITRWRYTGNKVSFKAIYLVRRR